MMLLNPASLWALSGLGVLLLLSLWRRKPQRVEVPSIRLWSKIPDRPPSVRTRPKVRLSRQLVFQMLTWTALVLAWAQPAVMEEGAVPRRVAFVFDTSASMAPVMGKVRERARNLLDRLSPADRVTLYAARPEPWIRRDDVRKGIDEVEAMDVERDVRTLLPLIRDDLVFVFTDEPIEGVRTVGAGPRINTGIVDARCETGGLFLRLKRAGPTAKCRVTLLRNGVETGVQDVSVDESGAVLSVPDADGARLEPDDFPQDDCVQATVEPSVEFALRGIPDPRLLRVLTVMKGVSLSSQADRVIFIREVPGSDVPFAVVIDPDQDFDGVRVGGTFQPVAMTGRADHSLLRAVDVSTIRPDEAREIQTSGEVILWADGRPVVVATPRRIVVGLRWGAEGWPSQVSFPIFWANVVWYASGGRAGEAKFWRTSEGHGARAGLEGGRYWNLLSERETVAPGLEASEVDVPAPQIAAGVAHRLDPWLLGIAIPLLLACWRTRD